MEQLANRGMNFCTTSGLLTATGAETVYDTTATINYVLNGKIAPKTAIADGVTPTTGNTSGAPITLTASQGRTVAWGLVSGGTVKVEEGPVVTLDAAGNFRDTDTPQFPSIPGTFAPFAYQVLKAGASAGTITFGSSNWNATGFTNAIVNVAVLPDRPQTS